MHEIRFMLVLPGFQTYIVRTPFNEPAQLQEWLETIRSGGSDHERFMEDPLAALPPKSFANLLITEEDLMDCDPDLLDEPLEEMAKFIDDKRTWDCCHGTLMVDDNDSVFYSVRVNKNSEWKLPFQLHAAKIT